MIIDLESNYKYLRVDFVELFKDIADLDATNVITTDIVNSIIVKGEEPSADVFNILNEWGFEKTNNGLNRFKLDVISLPIKQFRNQLGDLSLLGNLYNTNTIDDLNNLNKAIPSANKNIDIPSNLVGNFKYLRVDYEELFKTVAEYLDCTADDVLKILKNEVSDDLLLKIREKINEKNESNGGLINIWQDIGGSGLGVVQLDGDIGDDGDETSSHRYITGIDYVDARVIAFDVPNKRYVFNKNVIEFIPIDNSDKYTIKYSPQKEYLSDSLEGGTFTVDSSFVKLELFTNVTDEEIENSTLGQY